MKPTKKPETVYIVMTVKNDYKNVYGDFVFREKWQADMTKHIALNKGYWDEVYVLGMGVE